MTNYIKEKEMNEDTILEVANAIKRGASVVFKTDTVYGVGANAFDQEACQRIYEIKERPINKPLCVLISDISMLKEIVTSISPLEKKLMDAFWPGPLTIKFKKKENVLPDVVSAGDEYVRVRLIKDGLAYHLIQTAGVPIVAPSANLSGSSTGIEIKKIIQELGNKVDYILDSGDITNDITSTIVEIRHGKVMIIREGKIKKEEIEKVVPLRG